MQRCTGWRNRNERPTNKNKSVYNRTGGDIVRSEILSDHKIDSMNPFNENAGYAYKSGAKDARRVYQDFFKEVLDELENIKKYMEDRDAYHGYGQMNDLIKKLSE